MDEYEREFRLRVAEAVLNGAIVKQSKLCYPKWVVVMPDGLDSCERTVQACFERLFEEQDGGASPGRLDFAINQSGLPVFVLNGKVIGAPEGAGSPTSRGTAG